MSKKIIDSTNLTYLWGKIKNLVSASISGKANLKSPTFTGTPKAPTATADTNTTQIATTAFVQDSVMKNRRILGNYSAVTLPFTVPQDGFVNAYLNPSTTSGGMFRLVENIGRYTYYHSAQATTGEGVSSDFIVPKGAVITQGYLSGGILTVYFREFD